MATISVVDGTGPIIFGFVYSDFGINFFEIRKDWNPSIENGNIDKIKILSKIQI